VSTEFVLHEPRAIITCMAMTNITIKIESDLAQDARVMAAKMGTSLSRLVAEQLELLVMQDQAYGAAKQNALRSLKRGFDLEWDKPVSRDELHDRENLR